MKKEPTKDKSTNGYDFTLSEFEKKLLLPEIQK